MLDSGGTSMDLSEALERIDAIHAHVARGETYRGYHPHALAASGLFGLAAAFVPSSLFLPYWCAVGAVAFLTAAAPTAIDYIYRDSPLGRRRTRLVARQFAPCLLAGAVLTVAFARPEFGACWPLLPGAWSLLFGLGVIASLPYLPPLAGAVASWYLAAAVALLWSAQGPTPAGWTVGVTFGVGQLMAAGVVWLDRREGRDG
jgi:hypothetical protein